MGKILHQSMIHRIGVTFTLAVIALTGLASRAEGATFTAQGVFADSSLLSGTVEIDTVAGAFTAINLVVGPPNRIFSEDIDQQSLDAPWFYSVAVRNTAGTEDFDFGIPQMSLIGYMGGAICNQATAPACVASNLFDLNKNDFGAELVSGSFVIQESTQSAVPEPAPVAIVGSALAALWTLRRRRTTQQQSDLR